jgi:hypothetical protein
MDYFPVPRDIFSIRREWLDLIPSPAAFAGNELGPCEIPATMGFVQTSHHPGA